MKYDDTGATQGPKIQACCELVLVLVLVCWSVLVFVCGRSIIESKISPTRPHANDGVLINNDSRNKRLLVI